MPLLIPGNDIWINMKIPDICSEISLKMLDIHEML